MRNSMIVVA